MQTTYTSTSQYQQRALSPQEHVPYGQLVLSVYGPSGAIKREPFVGFKMLLRDPKGIPITQIRLDEIDHYLKQLLPRTGCILRQTDSKILPDGYWLITLPRPRSQVLTAIREMTNVLMALNNYCGLVKHEVGTIEVNVSGFCPMGYEQAKLQNLVISPRYQHMMISPDNSVYKFGVIQRINQNFMLFRARLNLPFEANMQEDLIVLTQLISAMF